MQRSLGGSRGTDRDDARVTNCSPASHRNCCSACSPTHDLRLFDGEAVRFACRCSRERVATMLQTLGREEVDSILAEQGAVTVTCEFCQRPYRFDAVDAVQLFAEAPSPLAPDSLN